MTSRRAKHKGLSTSIDTKINKAFETIESMATARGFSRTSDAEIGEGKQLMYSNTKHYKTSYDYVVIYFGSPSEDTGKAIFKKGLTTVYDSLEIAGKYLLLYVVKNKQQIHIVREAADYNAQMERMMREASSTDLAENIYMKIDIWSYEELQYNVAENAIVSPHTFATEDEITWLRTLAPNFGKIPEIKMSDPQARYIGAAIGDVIKYTVYSNAGKQTFFRLTVP